MQGICAPQNSSWLNALLPGLLLVSRAWPGHHGHGHAVRRPECVALTMPLAVGLLLSPPFSRGGNGGTERLGSLSGSDLCEGPRWDLTQGSLAPSPCPPAFPTRFSALPLHMTTVPATNPATGCGLSSKAPLLSSQCLRHQCLIYPANNPGKQVGDTQYPHFTQVQAKQNQRNGWQTLQRRPDN